MPLPPPPPAGALARGAPPPSGAPHGLPPPPGAPPHGLPPPPGAPPAGGPPPPSSAARPAAPPPGAPPPGAPPPGAPPPGAPPSRAPPAGAPPPGAARAAGQSVELAPLRRKPNAAGHPGSNPVQTFVENPLRVSAGHASARQAAAPAGDAAAAAVAAAAAAAGGVDDASDSEDSAAEDGTWHKPTWDEAVAFAHHHHPRDWSSGKARRWSLCVRTGRYCPSACRCCDPCCEGSSSQLTQYGPGINNYYKFIKLFGWTFFFLGVLTFPMLVVNMLAKGTGILREDPLSELGLVSTTVGHLGSAARATGTNGTVSTTVQLVGMFDVEREVVSFAYAATDLAACFLFYMMLRYVKARERSETRKLARSAITVDLFTIRVSGLPADVTRRELMDWFAEIVGFGVVDCVVVYDQASLVSIFKKRARLVRRRNRIVMRMRAIKDKMMKEGDGGDEASIARSNKRKAKLDKKLDKLQAKANKFVVATSGDTAVGRKVLHAYVTFNTRLGRAAALGEFPPGCCKRLCTPQRNRFRRVHKLKVEPAPRPSNIKWENVGVSACERRRRRCGSLFASFLLLCASATFLYLTRRYRSQAEEVGTAAITSTLNACPAGASDSPLLWNQTNATASDDGAGDTAARAAAGLCTCEDVTAEALFTLPECREFVALRALAATMTFVTAIGVVVVNMLFGRLMRTLAGYERHATATNQELALSGRLFTRMFLNTAILAVLINADVNRILRELGLSSIQAPAAIEFGKFSIWEFSSEWYEGVGTAILLTMVVAVVTPHVFPTVRCQWRAAKRCCARYCCKPRTQADLNRKFLGGTFRISTRYARALNWTFVVMLFSTGMPLLYWLAALAFAVTYWMDKALMLRFYRTPPAYEPTIGRRALRMIEWALLLHLLVAPLMLGNKDIFVTSLAQVQQVSQAVDAYAWLGQYARAHTIAHTLLGASILGYKVLKFALGKVVGNVLTALTCGLCSAGVHKGAEDLDDFDEGSGREWELDYRDLQANGQLGGVPTYYMVDNPLYRQMLQFDDEQLQQFRATGTLIGMKLTAGGV